VSLPKPQREARQVQGLDQDSCLGNKTVKMMAWSFSKKINGGLPVQSEILKITQMIYHYKMRTICKIHQAEFLFRILASIFLHFLPRGYIPSPGIPF
jgi:hypothetical protein